MKLPRIICLISFHLLAASITAQQVLPVTEGVGVYRTNKTTSTSAIKTVSARPLDSPAQTEFDGADGPYIINDTLYRVNLENRLIAEHDFNRDSIRVRVNNAYKNLFHFKLKSDYGVSGAIYPMPKKLVALSDIEGKFTAFSGFLAANGIIDKNHDWIFGDGHLVLLGDFVDRGKNVIAVLWLIYKLEYQARAKGGQVHFILGNHEVLNFQGDHRYNHPKYIKMAQAISGSTNKRNAVAYMYSNRSELGKWLATKNVIEKIGDYLFVHAGLSPEILGHSLSIDEINHRVRSRFHSQVQEKDATTDFLYSGKGPMWYRGLVMARPGYPKIMIPELDTLLSYYRSRSIVTGHTVVKDISTGFGGRVIRIDTPHGYDKNTGRTKGILIENGSLFAIDDLANRTAL